MLQSDNIRIHDQSHTPLNHRQTIPSETRKQNKTTDKSRPSRVTHLCVNGKSLERYTLSLSVELRGLFNPPAIDVATVYVYTTTKFRIY